MKMMFHHNFGTTASIILPRIYNAIIPKGNSAEIDYSRGEYILHGGWLACPIKKIGGLAHTVIDMCTYFHISVTCASFRWGKDHRCAS